MTTGAGTEDLLRDLAPQVLARLVRTYGTGQFDVCETSIEGCPAPQGRWDTVVTKLSMPPARVVITFVFSASSG